MKQPIALADIRIGDLIRVEQELDKAHEFRATRDAERQGWGDYYLLDRPKPAAKLPTEPTLGWLGYDWSKTADRANRLGTWHIMHSDMDGATHAQNEWGVNVVDIDTRNPTFVAATAVPTAALDEFRHKRETRTLINLDVDKFFTAVDEANR